MNKKVKYLLPAVDVDMGGFLLKQAFPTNRINQIDPFLLLHHANFSFNEYAPAIHQGIDPHPHRGFTAVTFVVNGEVHHRDSRGNDQIAKKGEVQWMHAGAGIIHSERPSQKLVEEKGTQETIQLWINSPADKKKNQPLYQFIKESDIPVFLSKDKLINNKLIAGNYNGLQSKIKTESELLIIWGDAKAGSSQVVDVPKKYNSILYLISGTMRITGHGNIAKEHLVIFENNADNIEMSFESSAQFLLLCGVPINEKVVKHGPYVMNTETEILEAMRDFKMGKMGILIEER